MIAPGSTIGILGGGQLGRMLALAAAPLGYKCIIFAPEAGSTAASVSHDHICSGWGDLAALARFRDAVDVVTLEFENVPVEALTFLEDSVPVRPGADLLRMTQDRAEEKGAVNRIGIATTRWRKVDSTEDLEQGLDDFGGEVILKTRRMGYDGKGQRLLRSGDDLQAAWNDLGDVPCIIEALVDFACEVSVIVARNKAGHVETFPVVRNTHEHHILRTTHYPADLDDTLTRQASEMAGAIAEGLGLEGLLAVEMFVTKDARLLVNELAPRPHNSGHWTIEGCNVSQFEQTIRAICDLPLKTIRPLGPTVMHNILGAEAHDWSAHVSAPETYLHLYDKGDAKPGRKMGHVTRRLTSETSS